MAKMYEMLRKNSLKKTFEKEVEKIANLNESIVDRELAFKKILEKYVKDENDLKILEEVVREKGDEELYESFIDAVKSFVGKTWEKLKDFVFWATHRGYQTALRSFLKIYRTKYEKFKSLTGLVSEFGESYEIDNFLIESKLGARIEKEIRRKITNAENYYNFIKVDDKLDNYFKSNFFQKEKKSKLKSKLDKKIKHLLILGILDEGIKKDYDNIIDDLIDVLNNYKDLNEIKQKVDDLCKKMKNYKKCDHLKDDDIIDELEQAIEDIIKSSSVHSISEYLIKLKNEVDNDINNELITKYGIEFNTLELNSFSYSKYSDKLDKIIEVEYCKKNDISSKENIFNIIVIYLLIEQRSSMFETNFASFMKSLERGNILDEKIIRKWFSAKLPSNVDEPTIVNLFISYFDNVVKDEYDKSKKSASSSSGSGGTGLASTGDLKKYMNMIISLDKKLFTDSPMIQEFMKNPNVKKYIESKGGIKGLWTTLFVKYVERYGSGDILEFINEADYVFYHKVDKSKIITQIFIAYYPYIFNGMYKLAKRGIAQPAYENEAKDAKFMKTYQGFLKSVYKDAMRIIGKELDVTNVTYLYTPDNDTASKEAVKDELVKMAIQKAREGLENSIKIIFDEVNKKGMKNPFKKEDATDELKKFLDFLNKNCTESCKNSITDVINEFIKGTIDNGIISIILDKSDVKDAITGNKLEEFIKNVVYSYISEKVPSIKISTIPTVTKKP